MAGEELLLVVEVASSLREGNNKNQRRNTKESLRTERARRADRGPSCVVPYLLVHDPRAHGGRLALRGGRRIRRFGACWAR